MRERHSRRELLRALGAGAVAMAGVRGAAAEVSPRCYVDGARGDDANDGRSPQSALKSLAAAAERRPSWLGLARGSHFEGTLRVAPAMTVEAYGEGPPPVIDAASPLEAERWESIGQALWTYGGQLAQVQRLVIDGRPSSGGKEVSSDDPN